MAFSAARMAMRILKAGGSAVDAVEAAIKVLEDKEITNAGYGSNLSIDGVVECDATLVDHLGRSGACGATARKFASSVPLCVQLLIAPYPEIKNPINLARSILDISSKPLSLRRVPPNLLVGQGATDFGWEQGIPVVPHDAIVSRNARDRYLRWRDDLQRAEGGRLTPGNSSVASSQDEVLDLEYEERVKAQQRRDHTNAILTGTWNEGQPDSPQPQPSPPVQEFRFPTSRRPVSPSLQQIDRSYLNANTPGHSTSRSSASPPSKRTRYNNNASDAQQTRTHSLLCPGYDIRKGSPDVGVSTGEASTPVLNRPVLERPASSDGPVSPSDSSESIIILPPPAFSQEGTPESPPKDFVRDRDEDLITDTVGAIAIDMYGHIAAGSSSGGIGMKHRGRVGPAALVGIGTAVIPVDPKDEELVSVAAVTSGTGEHMATTMASQKCAERLYHKTRRDIGGGDIPATEEEAMESFVESDFMGHPGVRESNSAGAIGVMAVKKTPYGYFLHFAHNTDSFALASMHSNEKDAKCVMSRIGGHGSVVQGGRKIRLD